MTKLTPSNHHLTFRTMSNVVNTIGYITGQTFVGRQTGQTLLDNGTTRTKSIRIHIKTILALLTLLLTLTNSTLSNKERTDLTNSLLRKIIFNTTSTVLFVRAQQTTRKSVTVYTRTIWRIVLVCNTFNASSTIRTTLTTIHRISTKLTNTTIDIVSIALTFSALLVIRTFLTVRVKRTTTLALGRVRIKIVSRS